MEQDHQHKELQAHGQAFDNPHFQLQWGVMATKVEVQAEVLRRVEREVQEQKRELGLVVAEVRELKTQVVRVVTIMGAVLTLATVLANMGVFSGWIGNNGNGRIGNGGAQKQEYYKQQQKTPSPDLRGNPAFGHRAETEPRHGLATQ